MQLWTGGEDGGIVQWRVPGPSRSEEAGADASDDRDPTPVAFLSGHTDRVSALCAVGDVVVSAGDDGVVCAWSIAKGASRCVARRAMGGEGCRVTALCEMRSSTRGGVRCVAAACAACGPNGAPTIALLNPRTLAPVNVDGAATLSAPSDASHGVPISLACRKPKLATTTPRSSTPGGCEWEWEGDLVARDASGRESAWGGPGRRRDDDARGGELSRGCEGGARTAADPSEEDDAGLARLGVRSSRVRTPSSAPEKEKREDEEEEEDVEEGLAATTDDDEETVHETPTSTAVVLLEVSTPGRASDVEIEVTRDATVTVSALASDGRTRTRRRASLSASWFPGESPPPGQQRAGSATATCFVGGGSLAPSRVVAGCDDGDLVIDTLPGGGDGDSPSSSFTIERAHAGAVTRATEAAGLLVTGGNDGVVRVWSLDQTPTGRPELRASLRHHSFAVTQIISAPVGFGGVAPRTASRDEFPRRLHTSAGVHTGGKDRFVFTVDASGALGLVDVERGRCEVFIPGVAGHLRRGPGSRERLAELLLDVGRGALALRYEGTHDRTFNRVRVWDLFGGGVMDRDVVGGAAAALASALRSTCHRASARGYPAWSPPLVSGDDVKISTAVPCGPVNGDWTQPGAPYVIANAAHLLNACRAIVKKHSAGWVGIGTVDEDGGVDGEAARALRMVAAAAGHAWGVDDSADAAASRALRAPSPRTPRASGGDEASSGSGVRTTRAAVGAGGAVTISAPRGDAQKDLGVWGREAATLRALALEACAASLHEMAPAGGGGESDRDRGDLALVRAFNASVHPLHLPTLASLYASPSADVRAAARSLLSNACNACAGRPAYALPAIFRETPSEALRECPKASGLEAWGAFEDAFDDDAGLEVFRDPSRDADSSQLAPRGCLGACVAAAACLANPPPGTHPALHALVVPALLELMRSCERVSLAGAAASMLGEGVERIGWGMGEPGGGVLEETLREACDTAEALANPSGIEPRGTSPSPRPSVTGVTGVTSPRMKAARRSADWTDRRSPRSPGSPVGSSRSPSSGGAARNEPAGIPSAPRRHPVGTPADRATARDAIDSLLFAAARSNPASFAKFLSARIQTAPPTSSSHVVALAALARVARESPHPRELLAPHVHALMNAVLAALNPANASLRRNCLVAATAVVAELARRLPNVTYHRATSRLAVGIDSPAPSGGTVAIVYDLALAATWRTLVDRDDHPAEEARRLIDGFGAGFGHMWATGLGPTHPGRSPSDKPKSDEPGSTVTSTVTSTDSSASTWTDGWTNTLASYAGSGTSGAGAKSPRSQRTSGDGWWSPFKDLGRGRRGGRRSSGGDGGGGGGGAFVSDSPTSPEARTARAHAAMAAIPVPETPEQRYAAAAAAAATAMTAHRADPPRKSFEGSRKSFQSTSTPVTPVTPVVDDDSARIEVMAWDEKGERLAAYLDRRSVVRVWNVASNSVWRPTSLFTRATQGVAHGGDASDVGYSHSVRCVVPSETYRGSNENDDERVARERTSLAWRDDKTVTLRRGGIEASFGVSD